MKKITLFAVSIFLCQLANSQYNKGLEIETLLKTDTTSTGQKISYPQFQEDQVTMLRITIHPGESTGWHKHEFPVFAYIMKGNLTVELENNKTMLYSENTSFAEVINTTHNGVNKGKEDVVLIAFFMGEKGKALSVHKD
jgi:quercetin dioxygenase-like cupin family protein